jgi:hypothetical protein
MFRSWVYNILFCLLLLVLMRGCAPTNQRSNSKGLVPLAPMPSEPTLEVAVLPSERVGEEKAQMQRIKIN